MPTNQTETATKHNVIIHSIGDSNPSAAKILSDALGIPVEAVVKGLYHTPTVLFSGIEEDFAQQVLGLLNQLKMDAVVQLDSEPIPEKEDPVDVGIYVEDIASLPAVVKELSIFLGCSQDEALKLLMNDPAVVLGGVSVATAEALERRINAEVVIVHPEEELYDIEVVEQDRMLIHQLKNYLKYLKIPYDEKEELKLVPALSYEACQQVWTKFQSTQMLKVINKGFQRFEILLNEVDLNHPNALQTLEIEIGIEANEVHELIPHLPVQIIASIRYHEVENKLSELQNNGLSCSAVPVRCNDFKLIIEENGDLEKSREVLRQFVAEEELPNDTGRWEIPYPLGDLLYRYIATQLEIADCEVDCEYFN